MILKTYRILITRFVVYALPFSFVENDTESFKLQVAKINIMCKITGTFHINHNKGHVVFVMRIIFKAVLFESHSKDSD